jgi:hypothetical protein
MNKRTWIGTPSLMRGHETISEDIHIDSIKVRLRLIREEVGEGYFNQALYRLGYTPKK